MNSFRFDQANTASGFHPRGFTEYGFHAGAYR